jgi:hypothetical protein
MRAVVYQFDCGQGIVLVDLIRRKWLPEWWMSHCSVLTTPQPPSALIPRIAAIELG